MCLETYCHVLVTRVSVWVQLSAISQLTACDDSSPQLPTLRVRVSQSYFTTGGLPRIGSSWCQAP
jgi:hypothetical protein